MPRRNDIKRIFLIGSGPIVIGQGCEFDYSGTQACKALKEEGYEVVGQASNAEEAINLLSTTKANVFFITPAPSRSIAHSI